jgi:hypothetical protein
MTSPRRLPLALALLVATPLALAACSPAAERAQDEAASAPASSEPSASASTEGSPLPADLTFAAGADLEPSTAGQWGDAMMADDDFAIAASDDGNGLWSYTHVPTQCVVAFWQGDVSSLGVTDDDRALSDEVLAFYFQATADEITPYAVDEQLPLHLGGTGTFDVRSVMGTNSESGSSYLVSGRGFGAFAGGYVVDVSCPAGQDPVEVRDALAGSHITLVLASGLEQ